MEAQTDSTDAADLFFKEMQGYLEQYRSYLRKDLTQGTVNKHASLIGSFIDELNARYGITGFEQITAGMCGSKFVRFYNSHSSESIQLQTAKNTIYRFFSFIYDVHGIANHELLRKLKK
jgi:hypothetical protein